MLQCPPTLPLSVVSERLLIGQDEIGGVGARLEERFVAGIYRLRLQRRAELVPFVHHELQPKHLRIGVVRGGCGPNEVGLTETLSLA